MRPSILLECDRGGPKPQLSQTFSFLDRATSERWQDGFQRGELPRAGCGQFIAGDEVALQALRDLSVASRKNPSDSLFKELCFQLKGWLLLKSVSELGHGCLRTEIGRASCRERV